MSFFKDVKSLAAAMEDLGKPFLEESEDLIVLDTKQIAGPPAVTCVRQMEALGREQCNTFITEHLVNQKKSLYDPIKRNKLTLFNSPPPKAQSKAAQQLPSMKSDCSLFARLYISCQTRDSDLNEFSSMGTREVRHPYHMVINCAFPKKKSELSEWLQANNTPQTEVPMTIPQALQSGL